MRNLLRHFSFNANRPSSGWLTLLLLLVVLVPSACVLWFMNQAMSNERAAVRQQFTDNLAQARDRLQNYWSNGAGALDTNLPAPALFAAAVKAGVADSVVCFDAAGNVAYPDAGLPREVGAGLLPAPTSNAPEFYASLARLATNDTVAARALQAQARCLMQTHRDKEAMTVLTQSLAAPRFAQATDDDGRWIVPNAELMALDYDHALGLVPNRPLTEKLRAQLLDYQNAMPAPQRRFLMHRLRELFPSEPVFPTLAAEELAADYLAAKPVADGEQLRPAPLTNVWQISIGGRLVGLFSTDGLQRRLALVLGTGARLIPPGQSGGPDALEAGAAQPGWQIAPSPRAESLLQAAADTRAASYLWVGAIALAAVAALALLSVRLIRRQVEVARLRNDLVANVTHELKTPLASMRLLVDTLLRAPVLNQETAREYLQLIARENLRLSRLIDNFLAFSRMERNKQAFDFSQTAPKDIVDAAAAAVWERFNSAACRFEVEAPPALPCVTADAGALVTALLNLLDNAYKYSGDSKEIFLRAGAENGHVTFAVRDNGIGVPPRETRRIFRRFYQVDQHMARTGGGCGLGLSIVQFIVTAHQGTVRVESEPGRGSTFTITLPAASPI